MQRLFKIFSAGVFIAVIVSLAPIVSYAIDYPWPSYRHDTQNTGRSQYLGPQTNSVSWTYSIHGFTEGAPAIHSDGTIYIGSWDGNLYSFYPDGTIRWVFPTQDVIRTSPAIGKDGTIYIGSYDGCFYAVNPDGTLKWSRIVGGAIRTSPSIGSDGSIYFGSRDGNLYALNSDGTLKWGFKTGDEIRGSTAIGQTALFMSGRMIKIFMP